MEDWFYGKDGTQHGPVSEHDMTTLISSGQVDASTIIWREGMADWLPVNQVPEFQSSTGAAQPTAVPIYAPGQAINSGPAYPVPIPTDGLSIASLVCGILALLACYIWGLFGLAAVICGHMSLKKIKRSPTPIQGKGMAIAGLICGYIGIVIQIVMIVAIAFAITSAKTTMNSMEDELNHDYTEESQDSPTTENPSTEETPSPQSRSTETP